MMVGARGGLKGLLVVSNKFRDSLWLPLDIGFMCDKWSVGVYI